MNTHSLTQGVLNANKLAHEKAKCVFEITQEGRAVCVLIKTSFHAVPQWSAFVLVKTKTKGLFFMLRFEKFTVGGLRNSSSSFFLSFLFFDSFYEGLAFWPGTGLGLHPQSGALSLLCHLISPVLHKGGGGWSHGPNLARYKVCKGSTCVTTRSIYVPPAPGQDFDDAENRT